MSSDFTSPESDEATRVVTGAVGSIQDHLRKPLWSPWVSLGVWSMLTMSVLIFGAIFAYIGGQVGWDVGQLTGAGGFGVESIALIVVGFVYDGRMVMACMGWNILAIVVVGILASG